MRFLKSIKEEINVKNLTHRGDSIEGEENISIFQQDWFEKLMPNSLDIYSSPLIKRLNYDQTLTDLNTDKKIINLKKNGCCINSDLVQFSYVQDVELNPNKINNDGEPDGLAFDIFFVKNESGIKMNIDITYGDHMAYEFTLESPNKINIVHYTGKGSLYDSDTHWGFTKESIQKIVDFLNRFNHGIKLTTDDLKFLDSTEDSYQHDKYNKKHLYSDESDLIKFGNSVKESIIKNFKNFTKKK
jgi:hypothetical protein